MLMGTLRHHLGRGFSVLPPREVAVVGAGIVGAIIAHALAQRGLHVRIYDPVFGPYDTPAQWVLGARHSGHDAVAMVPFLARQDPPRSRLIWSGIVLSSRRCQA